MVRTLEFFRRLPYRRSCERVTDEAGAYYVCAYPELSGLMADGSTRAEAFHNGETAFDDYIRARLAWGDEIPVPAAVKGKLDALVVSMGLEPVYIGPLTSEPDREFAAQERFVTPEPAPSSASASQYLRSQKELEPAA